jgi:primosomal protein N' (replication factor Y)
MSKLMAETLRSRLLSLGIPITSGTLVGPAPAFFSRYRGYYRWQILLRADDPGAVLRAVTFPFGWRVDIDPVTVL